MERNHSARTERTNVTWRRYVAILILVLVGPNNVLAGETSSGTNRKVRVFRAQHLILHTDLERNAARKTLDQLSRKLRDVTSYWSRTVSDPIRCYVVDDLDHWTAEELDDSYAAEVIQRVGGFATRHPCGAKMYASSDIDIALHEIVHAYCLEAFPNSGPDWYKEGMACLFANLTDQQYGIQVNKEVIDYLRSAKHRTARSIFESRAFTSPIATIIQAAVDRNSANQKSADELQPEDRSFFTKSANTASEQKLIDKANNSYRWSWALCHFLENNENYREQFRALGKAYLSGARPRFDQVFAANAEQLESEFRHFTRQLAAGYQVELCRWNWETPTKSVTTASSLARVAARRGLQSTGLRVEKGSHYAIKADGSWSIHPSGQQLTASGNKDGAGRLTASVLDDTTMGAPIDLSDGVFTATESGTLFFRCSDHWHEIGDNAGCIRVTIQEIPSSTPTTR